LVVGRSELESLGAVATVGVSAAALAVGEAQPVSESAAPSRAAGQESRKRVEGRGRETVSLRIIASATRATEGPCLFLFDFGRLALKGECLNRNGVDGRNRISVRRRFVGVRAGHASTN
jgi:hypothetical protein